MASEKGSGFSLKDHLFNRDKVEYLAGLLDSAIPEFARESFVKEVVKPFPDLELKQRIHHIAETLESHLDGNFRNATRQITKALPPPLNPDLTDDDFGDFIFAPYGVYVVRNGLRKQYLKVSLKTLKTLTQRFSMEDSIRPFINEFPEETLEELEKWAEDKNYHVRRLVSEGTRPSLPWSGKLKLQLDQPLPLLSSLHADPTRYVTRSVANHLNDIAKRDPKLVLATLKEWKRGKQQEEAELAWMSRHALRTLVKQGNVAALRFLGYRPDPRIQIQRFALHASQVKRGDTIEFSFEVAADRKEALMIDFVIDFVKANGETAPKVFKLKQVEMSGGESITIKKAHRLHAKATTYTLYPGEHRLTLQINGKPFASEAFDLI